MSRRDPLPLFIGVATALAYLARPSFYYNFDGVACAIAVELGDLAHLAHGNHVLYGLAGLAFHRLWQWAGYAGPALLPLQTLNALLGAAGAGVFCALLLRLGFSRPLAAAVSAALAVSQAYWFWSLEAQVYPLGALFCALAWLEACAERPDFLVVGLWQGLAVLGHVGHAMLAAPLLLLLAASGRVRRDLPRYAAGAGGVVLLGYLGAALFCVKPHGLAELRSWLLGSAALTLDHSVRWYGGYSWSDLRDWLVMTPRLFADFDGLPTAARAPAYGVDALALAACAAGLWRGLRDGRRRAAASAALWILSYAVLYTTWQPATVVYRISDLLPLWLLAAFGLESLASPAWTAAALALALGAFNYRFAIAPHADPASNAELEQTLWTAGRTPPQAWIVVTGLGQVYVPYFGHRRPLNMRYFEGRPEALAARLDALAADGQPVYVTDWTLQRAASGWAQALQSYGLAEAAEGPTRLWRVARPVKKAGRTGSPAGAAGRS